MGADGGTIVKKSNQKARTLEYTYTSNQLAELSANDPYTCALTHQTLLPPLVSDYRGELYNKEAVLQLLLDRCENPASEKLSGPYAHIQSLKDVVSIQATWNKAGRIVCPVMDREFHPGQLLSNAFGYFVPCGCMFHLKAMQQVTALNCPVCDGVVVPRDMIRINPTEIELSRLTERLEELKRLGLTHSLGKRKSKRKAEEIPGKKHRKEEASAKKRRKKAGEVEPERSQTATTG